MQLGKLIEQTATHAMDSRKRDEQAFIAVLAKEKFNASIGTELHDSATRVSGKAGCREESGWPRESPAWTIDRNEDRLGH